MSKFLKLNELSEDDFLKVAKEYKGKKSLSGVKTCQDNADACVRRYASIHDQLGKISVDLSALATQTAALSQNLFAAKLCHPCRAKDSLSLLGEAIQAVAKAHELVSRAHMRDEENSLKSFTSEGDEDVETVLETEIGGEKISLSEFQIGVVTPRSGGGGGK